MKRLALSITAPFGIIFSILSMTEHKAWCIFLLAISILMFIIGVAALLLKKSDNRLKIIGYFIGVIALACISSANLFRMRAEDKVTQQWTAELSRLNNRDKEETLKAMSSSNMREVHQKAIDCIHGRNGKKIDYNLAEALLRNIIDRGYYEASSTLSDIYLKGLGCEADTTRAYHLLSTAVKNGYLDAFAYIESLVEQNSAIRDLAANDLALYYEKREILDELLDSLISFETKSSQVWIYKITPEHLSTLEQLSDFGFTIADKLLTFYHVIKSQNTEKGRFYAERLYESGYRPMLFAEQLLMITLLEGTSEYRQEDLLRYKDKYNYYTTLYFPAFKQVLNLDPYDDYSYCRDQYEFVRYKNENHETLIRCTVFADDEETRIAELNTGKEMLASSIKEVENLINTLYP